MSLLRYARLPRPASTAAPPIPNSRPSCSPAVPPPPVDGGPAGTAGEVVWVAVAVCVGVAAWVAVAVCVAVAAWVAPCEPAGDVPAGLVPAVGLAGLVGLEGVHAETETETTTVKVAQAAK